MEKNRSGDGKVNIKERISENIVPISVICGLIFLTFLTPILLVIKGETYPLPVWIMMISLLSGVTIMTCGGTILFLGTMGAIRLRAPLNPEEDEKSRAEDRWLRIRGVILLALGAIPCILGLILV
jgi:hypothetical protein